MLTKQNSLKFERKKTELKLGEAEIAKIAGKVASQTTGEVIRDATIIARIAEKIGKGIDGGTALVGGTESSGALANIAFKTTKDIARGDKVYTGLCLVSATCETLALDCSTMKLIPFRGRIYIVSKIISKGCMIWRNACAGEGC